MANGKKGCGGCIVSILIVIGVIILILAVVGMITGGDSDKTPAENTPANNTPAYTSSGENPTEPEATEPEATEPEEEPDAPASEDSVCEVTPEKYNYYYGILSPTEQKAYKLVLEAAESGSSSFIIPGSLGVEKEETVSRVIYAFTYDHPEFYWLTNGWSASYIGTTWAVDITNYTFWDYSMNASGRIKELEDAVEYVADLAAQNASDDYGRAKFVHDYLTENAMYDYDALEEYGSANASSSCEYIFTAYGCLVNHRTVCAGYAHAFQMIMNKLGVPCTYVVGDAGEGHAWNRITLGGDDYYVDVTWDDLDEGDIQTHYSYFNITTNELLKSRTIDEEFAQPQCNSDKYNYYTYNGYVLDSYDMNKVVEIAKKQAPGTEVSFKFTNTADYNKAASDIEDGKWYDIFTDSGKSRYFMRDDMQTVTLFK